MLTYSNIKNERGAVALIVTILVLLGSMVTLSGVTSIARTQVKVLTEQSFSKQTYLFAEGALEEVVYRHKKGMNVSATEALSVNGVSVSTATTNIPGGKEVLATGDTNTRIRKIEATLIEGDGASFNFGVQTDTGGFILENSSLVNGNAYSNGPILGSNLNNINGSVVSAGPSGYVTEVHATGTVYAHEIDNSVIDGDAYYTTIDVGTTVAGTKHPGSPDLATTSLPITDELLDAWEAFASTSDIYDAECIAAGGTITYDADVTLGPVYIPCDVEFEKFPTVTVAGVIWIGGDVSFKQGPEFEIHAGIGNKSVPIVVDNRSDRLTSSRVTMENSGSWSGNGNRSYLMVVSRNESASQGGGEKAISIKNSTGGSLLVYSNGGEVLLENNTDLTEISAWRVRLQNHTEVNYDSGLASAVFTSGPGGSYVIDTWKEIE